MEYRELIPALKELCIETGAFIKDNFRKIKDEDIITKEKNSLVSYVDKQAEKMIIKKLGQLLPEAGFLTEEDAVKNTEKTIQWIVDPLDGTTNYITGIPHFSISIALKIENVIKIGLVYNVMQEDLYYAIRGEGAYLNEQKISVGSVEKLDEAVIATGFPYDKSKIDTQVIKNLNHFVNDARAIRRLGSAALDLCFTAQGTFHLYYERFLNAWDIAAGLLIVLEAGGVICDFNGEHDYLEKGEIIAASPSLKQEIDWLIG